MASSTDRIEKKVVFRAPIARVWAAIADSGRFGSWFGVKFEEPFEQGKLLSGKLVPTTVDPETAKRQEKFAGTRFEFVISRITPMSYFSFRWHPYAVERGIDYSKEPTTLVEFALEETACGTQLTISESGFDRIPAERRAIAFARNQEGWTAQARLIEKYVGLSE